MSKSARMGIFLSFILLAAAFAFCLRTVLLPLFLSLLFAYILQPAVRGLENLDVTPGAAIVVVYAYCFIVIAAAADLCLPVMISQSASLIDDLPRFLEQAQLAITELIASVGSSLLNSISDQLFIWIDSALSEGAAAAFSASAASVPALLRTVLCVVITPFLAYYVLLDGGAARHRIASWLPVKERAELRRLAGDIDHLLRQFIRGYLLVAASVGLLSAVFYFCIGLDYPLALGLIMGIADIIPYFGPFIGALPAVIVAVSAGREKILITVIGLIVIQQLESIVITPRVMGGKVGLHPLTTILAVLAGGWLFGAMGAILAVPVTASLLLIIRYTWSRLVGAKIF